jgi:hypothetical protein
MTATCKHLEYEWFVEARAEWAQCTSCGAEIKEKK